MLGLLLSTFAVAACPALPTLRDDDDRLVMLEQNLQFILIGQQKDDRARLLETWLAGEGHAVDLLLLSEARDVPPLEAAMPDWCFYGQGGNGRDGYVWQPADLGRSPGGLVVGVRQRDTGTLRFIDAPAGHVYEARPVSLAEGWLGRLGNFVKGWATLEVDDTTYTWTHTQASYTHHPELGAGGPGVGRRGQFDQLATALDRARPTLVTGDLNVLDGFYTADVAFDALLAPARRIDADTLQAFAAHAGIHFGDRACTSGTFVGTVDATDPSDDPYAGAVFDRVGVNDAFWARHPDSTVQCEEVRSGALRVSDHRGLVITVPSGR